MALPLGDPAYAQLDALERSGCEAARVSVARPYDIRSIRWALDAATRDARCTGKLLNALRTRFARTPADTGNSVRAGAAATVRATGLVNGEFLPLWENVRPSGQGDPPLVGQANLRLSWGNGDQIIVVGDAYVESNSRNDPLSSERQFRQSTAVIDMDEAYVAGRALGITFSLGRERVAWLGDSTESMILGANGPAINRISADFRSAHFEGHALFGSLDDVVLTSGQDSIESFYGPQRFYRYIAGHMLTWRPNRTVEVSAGETALLSRGSQTIDLYYVNPFVPYVITQLDTGETGNDARDNLNAFSSLRLYLGRTTLAGELLVDDIQIDDADRKVTPDQLGWRLTASTPLPLAIPSTGSLTYEHIDSYTYMRPYYMEVYQYYNVPLGSALGPDADYLHADADVFATPFIRLAAGLGEWRRGLQRIDERPAQTAVGTGGDAPFPTSTVTQPVQTALLGNVSVQLLTPVFPLTFRVDAARITNVNNTATTPTMYASFKLMATYAFRYP